MTKVLFYSLFREKLGLDSIEVKGDCKLEEVFEEIVKKTKAERSLFFEGEKIREEYIVLLNDKSVSFKKNVHVKDIDEVAIIPIEAGG